MHLHIPDWKCASIAATCLFGIAAFVVFVIHPGDFEGQGAWFLFLFPGSIPTALLSDLVYKLAPNTEGVVYWALFTCFNFAWYWGISYAIIKVFHASGWRLGSPEF
ncbi:MAG TPA: hypothetical protein VKH63_06855 [Candidatus Acidoferrum sp.]|nr:hypothetical protein [Candidatus Acidoferrum sp.]